MGIEKYKLSMTSPEVDAALQRAAAGGTLDQAIAQKAPAGFGLGDVNGKPISAAIGGDLNVATANGWYTFGGDATIANTPPNVEAANYGYMLVISRDYNDSITQIAFFETHSTIAVRQRIGTNWQPWEYINPPMQLGVEYRTTERYLGKPVYCRLVDFGALPNATTKIVSFNNNSSIIISAVGITSYKVLLLGTSENEHAATLKVRNNVISIKTINNQTTYTATILVKYYKDTD